MRKFTSLKDEPRQRLCLTFTRGKEIKYLTHLDIMRLWRRSLRRAGMPLSYSQGFNPQPKIAIASPLALGVTSEGELIDVFLDRNVALDFFMEIVSEQLPQGIEIRNIDEVWPKLPSMQSQLRFAEYQVIVKSGNKQIEIGKAVKSLLDKDQLPWQHTRDKEIRHYDLRALIDAIWVIEQADPLYTLGLRLKSDSSGSGRPEQVTQALGFSNTPISIHRTRLILEGKCG